MTTRARLIKEGQAFFKSVLEANQDLSSRLRELPLGITYDRDDDTFIVTLGEPQEALTESLAGSRLYIRVDPETLKIVGIEIPDLTNRIGDDARLKVIWLAARSLAGPSDSADVSKASERLARELRALAA